jgi:choline-sulfatase
VVLLADHGEGLGDHGETSHGYFIYESTIHVPLIIHWPSGSPNVPERVNEPGGLIDVAPTILDFLHITRPPSFEGISLSPGQGERAVYSESVYPEKAFGWAALRALRVGTLKYIDAPKPELYDLAKDPGELTNILAAHRQQAESMKAKIDDLLAKYKAKQLTAPPEVSSTARKALSSLGYTSGGKQAPKQAIDPKDRLAEHEAYENGLALLYSAHYDQAIVKLKRITAQDTQNLPALCALGEAYLRSGNSPRALALWREALEKNPAYRPAADSIGEYWLAQNDYDKACRYIPNAPQCTSKH